MLEILQRGMFFMNGWHRLWQGGSFIGTGVANFKRSVRICGFPQRTERCDSSDYSGQRYVSDIADRRREIGLLSDPFSITERDDTRRLAADFIDERPGGRTKGSRDCFDLY